MKDQEMTIEEATQILITNKNGTAEWDEETLNKAQAVAEEYEKTL